MRTYSSPKRAEAERPVPCPLCGSTRMRLRWPLEGYSFVRCSRCGLIQQNPQPLPEAVIARYDEAYLRYELENERPYRDLELQTLADLRFPFRGGRGRSFLDVGCATGALLDELRGQGWEVKGAEPDPHMAFHCRAERGLDVYAGPAERAPWEPGSFDVVHASHVIEHVNDPRAFLERLASLLKPEGLLYLTTPNAAGLQAALSGPSWRSAINDHLYLFEPRTLRGLLNAAGFVPLRMVTWGGWAQGLEPRWLKPILDPLSKRFGFGDVMAVSCAKRSPG